MDKRPHAVNQRHLVSWNNKPALRWPPAGGLWSYGTAERSQMHEAIERTLGANASNALQTLAQVGDEPSGPRAPGYFSGWSAYVGKDLRTLFSSERITGRYSRVYCGCGSRRRCRADLTTSPGGGAGSHEGRPLQEEQGLRDRSGIELPRATAR